MRKTTAFITIYQGKKNNEYETYKTHDGTPFGHLHPNADLL